MTATPVNVDNYARAEVAAQIDRLVGLGGELNTWVHFRRPTPIDQQNVIRMNRDTLYSIAVVDIADGGTLTVPEGIGRYLTVMVVNEDGYVNRVFHESGSHALTVDEFDTPYVILVARTLMDPGDSADLSVANALQDGLEICAGSARPWVSDRFDGVTYAATKKALLALGLGIHDSTRTFGRQSEVDPVRFLIGTAGGFGGLPEGEAHYDVRADPRPIGRFRLTVADVPVDGFWSISVYDRDGYFDENPFGSYSVNSVTASPDADGSVTVTFGPEPDGSPNFLLVRDGWNYVARMYRPRAEIQSGSWSFPEPFPEPLC